MVKLKICCLLVLLSHALFVIAGTTTGTEDVSLTMKDSGYSLIMNKNTGAITYLGQNENLLATDNEPLFRIRFLDADGTPHLYTAADARTCAFDRSGKRLTFTYSGFPDRVFQVRVSVMADSKDGLFHFSMKVDTDDQIEWMEYPCVSVKETSSEDEGILWPYNEGAFITDASKHNYTEPEYPSFGHLGMYPGMLSSPFIAQVTHKGGVYFGAHDPLYNTRHVDFRKMGEGIHLLMRLYPGVEKGSYVSGNETVLGCFKGDWHYAADIYRRYFDSHNKGFVRLEKNKTLPKWFFDPYVVVTYCVRGHHDMDEMSPNKLFPYVNAMPIIEDFTRQTGAPVLALLMHWEGTAPWAPPYVWPPYGGEEALKEFVNRMHGIGGKVGVYCSGMSWSQKSNLVEYDKTQAFIDGHLEKYMSKGPDGRLLPSRICPGQRSGYDLCPSSEFARNTLAGEMRKISSSGIDYVQMMDQNHGGTAYFCYSHEHGHPAVPGKWESEALNKLYDKVREENPGLVVGCESGASEPFIPKLFFSDNRNGLNFNGGQPVPLYAYIYHEYVTNFMGNNVCGDYFVNCRQTPEIFQYRLAYSFLAGDFLTVVINDEGEIMWAWGQRDFSPEYKPDREASLTLIKRLTEWRKACPEYLQLGRARHPIRLECGKSKIFTNLEQINVPDVLSASYERKGKTVHFLVNWRNAEVKVSSHALVGKKYSFHPDGERVSCSDGTVVMPPLTVMAVY
ncbi:MAG: hypothetical protein IJ626_00715 [Muribaculaceae bacterium]|nr:hypothetical protein [Muribaculaceae bacterium]